MLDDRALALARSAWRGAGSLDARDELARVERLRHVVVGADLEPDDLVDVLVARGQHQHRHVGVLADPLADLDAVDVRQHQVEHDERRLLRRDMLERVGAVRRRADGVARVLEVRSDEGGDRARPRRRAGLRFAAAMPS